MIISSNQALLLSIRPRFVTAIFSGIKTVELRRVKPRVQAGDLVIIYGSGSLKGIVGAFEVAGVTSASPGSIWRRYGSRTGLNKLEFSKYFEGSGVGHAIRIKKYWELPRPISLSALRRRHMGFRPPQSYHYWNFEDLLALGGDSLIARFSKKGTGAGRDRSMSCRG